MAHHGILSTHRSRIKVIAFNNPDQHQPVICQACDDAPCIKVCPVNARIRLTNQTVTTDDERCIGCRACLYICHQASPVINPDTGKTMTCDLCADEASGPWCVSACRSENALMWLDSEAYSMHAARLQAARMFGNRCENLKRTHTSRVV
jgi:anaerobic carbon-monoxide dehydrogenase iron sulfur subunit